MANIALNSNNRDRIAGALTAACQRRFNAHRLNAPFTAGEFQKLLANEEQVHKLHSLVADGFSIDRWSALELMPQWEPLRNYKFYFSTPTLFATRNDYYTGAAVGLDAVSPDAAEWLRLRWLEARRLQFARITISKVIEHAANTTQVALMLPGVGRLGVIAELQEALDNPSRRARLQVLPAWADSWTMLSGPNDQSVIKVHHGVLLERLRMLLAEATLFPAAKPIRSETAVTLTQVQWMPGGDSNEYSIDTLSPDLWEATA